MAYADFTYYTNTYLGNAIASGNFPRLELRARAVIDLITNQQAADIITIGTDTAKVTAIKMAVCAVAEEVNSQDAQEGKGAIASESTGRHSVSYVPSALSSMTNRKRQEDAAYLYLAPTGLLYRGVYPVSEDSEDAD